MSSGDNIELREIVEETLLNLERVESEIGAVKRRLKEHMDMSSRWMRPADPPK